ncbi:hypothetical protein ABPG75_007888 [Micractinium tetrahymenae]
MSSLEFIEAVSSGGDGSRLVVRHTRAPNGWASLPPTLCARLLDAALPLPLALELRPLRQRAGLSLPSDTPIYVAWDGASSGQPGIVGLPAALARALGLADGTTVAVKQLAQAPPALSVTVEPASEDDWEVVEMNAGFLEEQLLTQVGVASPAQPLPAWIRSMGVMLRVTAMEPAVPVARLVPGTEIYVAPRLRVRPAAAVAASGELLPAARQRDSTGNGRLADQWQDGAGASKEQQQEGQGDEHAAAAPLQAVLRVQQLSAEAASSAQQLLQQQAEALQPLPPGMQRVLASAASLARCGLHPGDWVRLSGRSTRSLVKFACLVASELAAPGHLALTVEQSEWAGAPPFSPVRLQRLTRSQRQLVVEATEVQGGTNGSSSGGSNDGTEQKDRASRPVDGIGLQQQQQPEQEQGGSPAPGAAQAGASWLRPGTEQALRHLLPILGFTPRSLLQSWGAPRPGGLLVCGPAGSGKSGLLVAAAAALRQHPECLTYTVTVSCRDISAEGASQAQAQILPKVQEALDHLPSLLVLDDLDVLCPAEASGADGAASSADPALVTWLCDLLDHLSTPSPDWGRLPLPEAVSDSAGDPAGVAAAAAAAAAAAGSNNASNGSLLPSSSSSSSSSWGGPLWPPLAVAATCRDPAALAAPLRAAGRLDHSVTLPAPSAESRAAILGAAVAARGAHLAPQLLRAIAEKADGFDAADLEVLLDRAMHVAVRRQLAAGSSGPAGGAGSLQLAVAAAAHSSSSASSSNGLQPAGSAAPPPALLQLTRCDMEAALEGFTPAAFWGIGTRKAVQAGVVGWADVGGMEEAREALHEALELPTKYAQLVAQAPLRLRTGVLLYGPPGCGKTHIVAAAVAAAGVRCITVSGPELLNKYIGASEAAVRDVFARAAAAAPAVLFFDEFDAIAPQRGHDNTGVTDRVVNQLLTELDGVEGLRGVCVVAATSRPDLIDAALLRPGRLDRLVFCGFPSPLERGAVLRSLSRGVMLATDVDLALVGYNAEFYSGADLAALLAEAQLAAVHEALEAEEAEAAAAAAAAGQAAAAAGGGGPARRPHTHPKPHARAVPRPPLIQARHLQAALATARPSVPEAERERLEAIYARFRQDRQPGQAAAADKGKGKLVSWA